MACMVLCMGGNDFVPKLHMVSHSKVMSQYLTGAFTSLLQFIDDKLVLDYDVFVKFVQDLFCPKRLKCKDISFAEVRAITIQKQQESLFPGGKVTSNPQRWLPPESAVRRLAELVDLQIMYLDTAGHHAAELPNFLGKQCLKKSTTGEIEYDFGPEARTNVEEISPLKSNQKRAQEKTPQKGKRKKKLKTVTNRTSTPKGKK